MIETLLGGVVGGVLRLAPEVLNFLDAKSRRVHELLMQDKQLEFTKLQGMQKLEEVRAEGDNSWDSAAIEALKESITGQMKQTGIRWVDAVTATVRPFVTYWFLLMYAAVKFALFAAAMSGGMAVPAAILAAWTVNDWAVFTGILNFWFVGRVFDKMRGR